MTRPLLTIAIPTYNRAKILSECLNVFLPQVDFFKDQIEFIISDNGSTDETQSVIKLYKEKYPFIKILKNSSNLGPDNNFAKCYNESLGDFLWVFSDDDNINPALLTILIEYLKVNKDFSLIYLNHSTSYNEINSKISKFSIILFSSMINFLDKASWLPFISAIIVNKKNITDKNIIIDFNKFIGSYLIQLSWFFESYLLNSNCVFIENKVVYNRPANSGGYNYFKTFLESYNVMLNYYIEKGLDTEIKHKINNIHIKRDFKDILTYGAKDYTYSMDGSLKIIFKELYIYFNFWTILFPIIVKNCAIEFILNLFTKLIPDDKRRKLIVSNLKKIKKRMRNG
jgi:abequosyltransferase